MPALSLVLLGVLTACSDAGIDDMGPQTSTNTVTPSAVTPSRSAAELTDDNTVTVQAALAVEEQTDNQNQAITEAPAAANPDTVTPVANLTDSEDSTGFSVTSEEDTDTGATNTSATTEPSQTESTLNAATTDSDDSIITDEALTPASAEQESISQEQSSDNIEISNSEDNLETIETSSAEDNLETIETSSSEDNLETEVKTRFESKTTPGFEGEVLEDSIRLTWNETPSAIGYNVYKQADYYVTVQEGTEFIDTEVFDDDYYYEIQAYADNENGERYYWYVATGLTVSASTFGVTDPDAPQPKEDLLDDYEMVFSDEFNNTELDTSKWNTSFLWGTDLVINQEEQYYVDIANDPDFGFNPFSFDGENLTISTIETPAELSDKANNQSYLSGIITSYDAFKFTYGYAETRAKFTHGRGYWPAFWLLNAYYGDADPEIDIMEFIGHNQDVVYHTYHYYATPSDLRSTPSFPVPGTDYTADFHTFGVEWMPGTLIFYIDGVETYKIVDINVSDQEMYVIANQAVGGWWAGSPDETTPLPGEFAIDYIRIYQRITPYEIIEFDQPDHLIPLFTDSPGQVIPNKRPPVELWPEGYPTRQ